MWVAFGVKTPYKYLYYKLDNQEAVYQSIFLQNKLLANT
jgi:hypothetical protein